MKPKQVSPEIVSLRTDVKYQRLEFLFGQAFYQTKRERQLHLNLTPNDDPTLVPINELVHEKGTLQFSATVKGKERVYAIRYHRCPFGPMIASFVMSRVGYDLDLDPQGDDFELYWEYDWFNFTLSNSSGRAIIFHYPNRRATHLYRRSHGRLEPDHYQNAHMAIEGNSVILFGEPKQPEVASRIEFQLNFQAELLGLVRELVDVCISGVHSSESPLPAKDASHNQSTEESTGDAIDPDTDSATTDIQRLNEMIAHEKTLGEYWFDESQSCFVCDTEVVLYLTKQRENVYRLACYFFDGYEVGFEEDESEVFSGDEVSAKQQAIESFQQETFMTYPIVYSNITCNLLEDEI